MSNEDRPDLAQLRLKLAKIDRIISKLEWVRASRKIRGVKPDTREQCLQAVRAIQFIRGD